MSYLWLRASNDFGASHYGIQTIKMGFNPFWMLVTFQHRGLLHLDMHCTLINEVWLKSNIHFDCRYLELRNACIISLVFIVLNVRNGTESKYHSIVFLSILIYLIYICRYCFIRLKDLHFSWWNYIVLIFLYIRICRIHLYLYYI